MLVRVLAAKLSRGLPVPHCTNNVGLVWRRPSIPLPIPSSLEFETVGPPAAFCTRWPHTPPPAPAPFCNTPLRRTRLVYGVIGVGAGDAAESVGLSVCVASPPHRTAATVSGSATTRKKRRRSKRQ